MIRRFKLTMLVIATGPALIAVLSLGNDVIQSQPPPPAPPKGGQHQKPHTDQSTHSAKAPNGNSDKAPLSVTLNGPVTIQKSEQDRNDERKESEHKTSNEWWLIVWTFCLALVTLVLAVITGVLARYTYKLWRSTAEASARQASEMQASLSIAQVSADAAVKTVQTMQDTAERQLRAYVGVSTVNIDRPLLGSISVQVDIKNTGQTPAYNVRTWSVLGIFGPSPETQIFRTGEKIDTHSMIGGGVSIQLRVTKESLQHDAITGISSGDKPVYFWGEILYRDVFDRERRTRFRLRGRLPAGGSPYFETTHEGNEAT